MKLYEGLGLVLGFAALGIGITQLAVLPPTLQLDPWGVPQRSVEGYTCETTEDLAPRLQPLVHAVKVCTIDGDVVRVEAQPRHGSLDLVANDQDWRARFGMASAITRTEGERVVFLDAARVGSTPTPARVATSDDRSRRERRSHRERPSFEASVSRSALMSDLSELGRAHRMNPGDGYRISGIRHGSVGDRLGLRNGDVVTHLDGHALTDFDAAMRAWEGLPTTGLVRVELVRQGVAMTLDVRISA